LWLKKSWQNALRVAGSIDDAINGGESKTSGFPEALKRRAV